jgi:hypothetical protein
MQDLLSRLTSTDVVGIVFFILLFLAGMIVWLSLQWRLHRRTEMAAALKQDMLNRGMSAAEIERVLRASLGGASDCAERTASPVPPAEVRCAADGLPLPDAAPKR